MKNRPAVIPVFDTDRIDRLRLIRSDNVGPITYRRLMDRYPTAEAALAALPALARKGGRPCGHIASRAEAEAEIERLAAAGGRLVILGEPEYPERLAAIEDAPPVISVLGDVARLAAPCVAIVGSRNASLNGRRLAEHLAAGLGEAGFIVVSGLARGIDTAAHRGALATGTIAVMAGGVDIVYPEENRGLYGEIAQSGAVVAELAVGRSPQARHFPRRNRLISGLSFGTVVVEATLHSGSLITARLAAEQGRDVFAVPGSPLDPRARGCNDLLRQGAILTESIDDILSVVSDRAFILQPSAGSTMLTMDPAMAEDDDSDEARRVLAETLSVVPVQVDDLVRNCNLPPALVHTILLEWELAGRIERRAGNRVSLIAPSDGA